MPPQPPWTRFRFRLAAAILAASLLPIALIWATTLALARGHLEEVAIRHNAAVLDVLAGDLALNVAQRVRDLQQLALDPRVASLDPRRAEPAFGEFMVDESFFVQLDLRDLHGARLAGGGRGGSLPAGAVEALARVAAGGRPEVVGPGPAGGEGPTLLVPVGGLASPGSPRAVLVGTAVLDGTDIQAVMDLAGAGEDGYVCIVDTRGGILARRGTGLAPEARAFAPAARFAAPAGEAGARTRLRAADGDSAALVSMAWSPALGAWLVRGEPWDQAFALVGTLEGNFAAALLLATAAALAASAWLVRVVGDPISALAAALGSLQQGVLTARVEASGDDELAVAGRAFNDLASELQKRALIGAAWEELRKEPGPGS